MALPKRKFGLTVVTAVPELVCVQLYCISWYLPHTNALLLIPRTEVIKLPDQVPARE
jgi:hypothetical protein